jgi:hypothetical protein
VVGRKAGFRPLANLEQEREIGAEGGADPNLDPKRPNPARQQRHNRYCSNQEGDQPTPAEGEKGEREQDHASRRQRPAQPRSKPGPAG